MAIGLTATLLVGAPAASGATPPTGAAGALDPTFATASGNIASLTVSGTTLTALTKVLVQPADGKIIVGGLQPGTAGSVTVARFNANGTIDTSFGGSGTGWIKPGLGSSSTSDGAQIALQPDGKIVVVGSKVVSGQAKIGLTRLNANGTLDTAFGSSGFATYAFGTSMPEQHASGVVLLPSGQIVVSIWLGVGHDAFKAMRFSAAGVFDTSFGSNGLAISIVSSGKPARAADIAVTSDGKYVEVGSVNLNHNNVTQNDTAVVRFTSAGQPDSTFSGTSNGAKILDQDTTKNDAATALVIDSVGTGATNRIFVSGTDSAATSSAYMLALTSAGAVDSTFGAGGVLKGSFGGLAATGAGVAIDGTRRLVAVGGNGSSTTNALGIERLSGAGAYDASFGTSGTPGKETIDCASGQTGAASGIAVQTNQQMVVVGACNGVLKLARLNPGNITNLAMTSSTPNATAGHADTAMQNIPASALTSSIGALTGAPLRNNPTFGTPIDNAGFSHSGFSHSGFSHSGFSHSGFSHSGFSHSPLTDSGFSHSGFSHSGFSHSAIDALTAAQIPLTPPKTWETVLAGTPCAAIPLQDLTLGYINDNCPQVLNGLTTDDIDVNLTPFRNASLAGYALGNTPVSSLPSVCTYIASQAKPCSSFDATATSLLDLELAGDQLGAYYAATTINLNGLALVASPVPGLWLDDMELSETSFGGTLVSALVTKSKFVTCGTSCAAGLTLAQAQANGQLVIAATATLGALIADSPAAVGQVPLGPVLVSLVPRAALPIEQMPYNDIVSAAALPAAGSAAFSITFDLGCGAASGLTVRPTLPSGFRIVPSTVAMTVGGATKPVAVTGQDTLSPTITPTPTVSCSGVQPVVVSFTAEPGFVLGTSQASSAVVSTSFESVSTTGPSINVVDSATGPAAASTPSSMVPIGTDHVYTNFIGAPGNVDYYSIPAQPAGSGIIVTLSHLPADYDLLLYGPAEPSLRSAGFSHSPFSHSGFSHSDDQILNNEQSNSPAGGGSTTSPELLQDVPQLSDQAVRSASTNRGTSDEAVYTLTTESDTTGFIVQVSGYNGASSPQPYILRVTIIPPTTAAPCATRFLPNTGVQGALPASIPSDTQTLFIVNQKRLGDLYGASAAQSVIDNLNTLKDYKNPQDPNDPYAMKGAVLAVDGDPTVAADYQAWDANSCSPKAANTIVHDINNVVDGYAGSLSNLRFIVLVGNDEVVPFGRTQDLSPLANEAAAATDIQANGKSNPESAAMSAGYLLTDNPYGDLAGGQPWGATTVYNPQVAVGRLVETPADINLAISQYMTSNGVRSPNATYNAAYDWMATTGQAVATALAPRTGTNTSNFSSTWTANDVAAALAANAHGFIAVNAHSNFNQSLSAADFTSGTTTPDLLTTSDLPASLQNAVLLTLGCHFGLNAADTYVGTTDPAAQATLTDWAQAVLSRGGVLQATTGYGLGDTEVIAYSGRLLKLFAQKLDGTSSVGQALMLAKQEYVQLGVASFYDAKAMEEATFYGLPMYRLGATGTIAKPSLTVPTPDDSTTVKTTTSVTVNAGLTPVTPADGSGTYYTTSQDPQVTPREPIEPRTVTPLTPPSPDLVAHDAVTEQKTTADVSNFDPVYSATASSAGPTPIEPIVNVAAFPSQDQQVVGSLGIDKQGQNLVYIQGQFSSATKIQRNTLSAQITVNWSKSSDFVRPTISTVSSSISNGTATFTVTTPSSDASRGVVLFLPVGGPSAQAWTHVELVQTSPGVWTGTARLAAGVTVIGQFDATLCDGAGNCGHSSNKAINFSSLGATASYSFTVNPGAAANGLYPDPTTVQLNGPAGVAFTYKVDNGASQPCVTSCTINVTHDGAHSIVITAPDGSLVSAAIPIDAHPPVVNVASPIANARVKQGAVVNTSFSCASQVQITGCAGPTTLDTTTMGNHTFTAVGTDQFGLTTTVSVPYYVDGTPPTFAFSATPPVITKDGTATFNFSASDPDESGYTVTFTCKLDNASAAPCTSPITVNVPTPIDGNHTFSVVATDRVGNATTKAYAWRIDTTAPMFTTFIGPADPSGQTSANFAWAVDDGVDTSSLTFTCKLGTTAKPCTSTGATLSGLVPQTTAYTFTVTATDPAGNQTTITHTWHVYQATQVQATGYVPGSLTLKAKLVVDNGNGTTGAGIAGQKVFFYLGRSSGNSALGSQVLCGSSPDGSATTDAGGTASCGSGNLLSVVTSGGFTAVYTAAPPYFGSRGDAGLF